MRDAHFRNRQARTIPEQSSDPILQWANGVIDIDNNMSYVGWMSEHGKNKSFDMAMLDAGFFSTTIKHGSGKKVRHWLIPTVGLYPLIEHVSTFLDIKTTPERYGMALGWRTLESGAKQSFLKFKALMTALYPYYCDPVMVSVKSTVTDDMIAALLRQYDILDWITSRVKEGGREPRGYPFYAIALYLGAGEETRRGESKTSPVVPPINAAPKPMTREYAAQVFIGRAHYQPLITLIESLLDDAITWSTNETERMEHDHEITRLAHGVH